MNESGRCLGTVKFMGDPGASSGGPFRRFRDEGRIRKNLTGDQPKLFPPWLALQDEPAAAK